MSATEVTLPSRRLRSAAEAERERLGRELARLDSRADRLQTELTEIDRRRAELRDQLALLARLAWQPEQSPFPARRSGGRAAHLQAVPPDQPPPKALLRGARIRETAVLLLASSANPARPIHYQQWYKLFRDAGYGIEAQDPLATFLTQITRSPAVRRADAPGVYALDLDAPQRLREQLRQLEADLARLPIAGETAAELAKTRAAGSAVTNQLRTVQRQLEEVLRSLGEPSAGQ